MKKNFISANLFAIFSLILIMSCSDDTTSPNVGTPFVAGYNSTESSESMTLATLSYVNENNPAYLRDSLIIQLANTNYATGGKWKLAWGPALSPDGGNLLFVTKDTTTEPDRYTIAIRGTDWCFPFNWKEDLGAIEFDRYPYGGSSADSISHGALFGLQTLLALRDSSTGKLLSEYLTGITAASNQIYITGHSLGGMLATVYSAWFLDNGFGSKFNLKAYTFAAPSCGNEQFVQHYTQIFSAANAESHRVENPKDLVHYFNGDLAYVLANNIPTAFPFKVEAVFIGIESYFETYNMVYRHVGERYALGTINPADCNYPSGTLDQYECWVGFEHTTSTYLTLLNAPQVNFSTVPCKWILP